MIRPDTKDWTWVLERRCPECGFEAASVPPSSLAERHREIAASWVALLSSHSHDELRARPDEDRWSALEYGCHVRDVYRICGTRLERMLGEDDPIFANWDQDATAVDERYGEQDPVTVGTELSVAADSFCATLGGVEGAAWQRPGMRSDGARFQVESFARYVLHDPFHHLLDVGGLA